MPFEPGQSGNPNGRPKAERAFANMLRIAIKEAHDDGRDKLRAVADALVTEAIKGDIPAIREIADRLDGKVAQAIVGGDEDDNPVSIVTRIRLLGPDD